LVFFFNSYFYTKLIDGGTTARTRHDAVKRWTNRLLCQTKPLTDESSTEESLEHLLIKDQKDVKFYNKLLAKEKNQNLKLFIWDFDIVGIPLHDSAHHWTLMLVCYPYAALRAPIKSTTALEEDVTSTSKAVVDSIGVNSLEVDTEARDDNSTENTLSCGLQSFDGEKMPNLSFVEVLLKHKIDSGYFLSCPQKAAIFHLDSLEYTFSSPTHIKEIIVEYFQQVGS
jgi:Ulp1 family protease